MQRSSSSGIHIPGPPGLLLPLTCVYTSVHLPISDSIHTVRDVALAICSLDNMEPYKTIHQMEKNCK